MASHDTLASPLLPLTPSFKVSPTSDVPAILLIVGSEALLAAANAAVQFAASWPAERLVFVRCGVELLLSACVVAARRPAFPAAADAIVLAGRGLAYCAGTLGSWAALRSCLPVDDAAVLWLSASPLLLVLLARLLLDDDVPATFPLQAT